MVQIICGDKGKGKTTYLLEKANSSMKEADGSVVYLDKNSKHMLELNNKIRLIDVSRFPVSSPDGFLGFIAGIISQDGDLQFLFLDSFLKISGLEENGDLEGMLRSIKNLGETYGVKIFLSISLDKSLIPSEFKDDIIVAL